jgi:hypothetical protein
MCQRCMRVGHGVYRVHTGGFSAAIGILRVLGANAALAHERVNVRPENARVPGGIVVRSDAFSLQLCCRRDTIVS